MIRVLLVTEIELMGNVVGTILADEADIEVIGSVSSVSDSLNLVGQCDVLLVSPRLPDDGALQLIRLIAERYPTVKALVFGLTESRAQVLKYIEAGADGYVVKDSSVEDLLDCIRAADEDKAVVSPKIAAALMSEVAQFARLFAEVEPGVGPSAELTPRERQVLELIRLGLTNQQIADHLVIEVGTVKNHVHSILKKLDVSNRQDAAAYLGVLQSSESELVGA
jgi:DNA-binding NarL/FixJ family response regulator